MKISFNKFNGAGNDFIIIDNRDNDIKVNSSLVSLLCNRNFGVGADGVIVIKNCKKSDFEILHFTPDGEIGSLCGNGSRCAVSFAHKNKIIENKTTFKAFDGFHNAEILNNNLIKMEMNIISDIIENEYGIWVDTGSPHLVIRSDDTESLNVYNSAREIRYNDYYRDEGVNVNFVEKIDDEKFKIRTYERGVEDETLACGTGSTASAICMNYLNITNKNKITMECKGGNLFVEFNSEEKEYSKIYITGPANFVFEGTIDLENKLT